MSWSLPLGSVAGIALRVHFTFFFLLIWIGALLWINSGAAAAADGIAFIIVLFACVVLHELGHALTARRYGIKTKDITLLPIGGVASLDRMPTEPGKEIMVALAGPAVNVVIALVLFLIVGANVQPARIEDFGSGLENFLGRLATVNVVLAVFNLLPAFPMDGGRVLRAVLSTTMPRTKATRIAAMMGKALAFAFALLGLLVGNPLLILIGIFIYFAADSEAYGATLRDFARGLSVEQAMISRFESLRSDATLDDAARLLLETTQQEFPVLAGGATRDLSGFVTRTSLIDRLKIEPGTAPLNGAIIGEIPSVPKDASLLSVVDLLQTGRTPAVAVTGADDGLLGYVTMENLAEFFMIREAGDRPRAP